MPEIFSGPVTGCPSIRILPMDGMRSPVVSFMNVDLPQPDGPTMAMNSPWRTCRLMPPLQSGFGCSNSAL